MVGATIAMAIISIADRASSGIGTIGCTTGCTTETGIRGGIRFSSDRHLATNAMSMLVRRSFCRHRKSFSISAGKGFPAGHADQVGFGVTLKGGPVVFLRFVLS